MITQKGIQEARRDEISMSTPFGGGNEPDFANCDNELLSVTFRDETRNIRIFFTPDEACDIGSRLIEFAKQFDGEPN